VTDTLPEGALLKGYQSRGAYTDCLTRVVAGQVTLEQYVTAFYSSPAFRPERVILSVLLAMPSTDRDIGALAEGGSDRFAAWTVEGRLNDQILLCDYQSRTRSWLMVEPLFANGAALTRLYFGTAVTQVEQTAVRRTLASIIFHCLLWFHKIYARALIGSAAKRLG
jgi:hypothetical protein